jgi:hypothetical protein
MYKPNLHLQAIEQPLNRCEEKITEDPQEATELAARVKGDFEACQRRLNVIRRQRDWNRGNGTAQ